MIGRHLALAAGLAAAAGFWEPALAQSAPSGIDAGMPEGLVWMALRDINAALFDDEDPTNHPPLATVPPEGMIRRVNVSDDGRPDWLIDYEQAGVGAHCGTGGCVQKLYVSTESGYVRAFDRQAHSLTVNDEGGVTAWVHALHCVPRRDECRFAWSWDVRTDGLIEQPVDGVTVLAGGGFAPLETTSDSWPEPLRAAYLAAERVCRVEGRLELRAPVAASVSDLNGDGARDWFLTPAIPCENASETPGQQVWLSTRAGSGGFVLAYEAPAGRFLALDIGPSAAVLDLPACGQGDPCQGVRLRLDRSGRRLTR